MEEYLTAAKFANKLGFSPATIRIYASRSEFAPYRKEKPTKILWCEETKKLFYNFIKKKTNKEITN